MIVFTDPLVQLGRYAKATLKVMGGRKLVNKIAIDEMTHVFSRTFSYRFGSLFVLVVLLVNAYSSELELFDFLEKNSSTENPDSVLPYSE